MQVGLVTGHGWQAAPWFEQGAGFLEGGQTAAQTYGTEVALQTDAALPLEQWTAIRARSVFDGAGVWLVADFQLEQRAQAAAQIFHAFEAQFVVIALADGGSAARQFGNTCIYSAIDGHGRLGIGCARKCAHERQSH